MEITGKLIFMLFFGPVAVAIITYIIAIVKRNEKFFWGGLIIQTISLSGNFAYDRLAYGHMQKGTKKDIILFIIITIITFIWLLIQQPIDENEEKDIQTAETEDVKGSVQQNVLKSNINHQLQNTAKSTPQKESKMYIAKKAVDEYINTTSKKLITYRVITAMLCVAVGICSLVIYYVYQNDREQIEKLDQAVNSYVKRNVELKNENNELSKTNETISKQLDSYHYCTALLNSTKDKYYHIIGCKNLNDEFYVYGNTNAKNKGYKPCPDCLGE